MKKILLKLIYFLLLNLMILYVLHVFPIKLSKEMNIVFAHAQITYKQSVWGIICKAGVVHRILTGVYDSVGRNRRTRTSYISYPIKDDISILGKVGSIRSVSLRSEYRGEVGLCQHCQQLDPLMCVLM